MGVHFYAAKGGPTLEDNLRLLESGASSESFQDAIRHLRTTIEEEVDLESRTWDIAREAPSPHLPYTAFHRWRVALAEAEGVDLLRMHGYEHGIGVEGYQRVDPFPTGAVSSTVVNGTRRRHRPEVVADVNSKLEPLLRHSDYDGELTPGECRQILEPLREAQARVQQSLDGDLVTFGEEFVELVAFCADHKHSLLFR